MQDLRPATDPWAEADARSDLGYNLPARSRQSSPRPSPMPSATPPQSHNPRIGMRLTEFAGLKGMNLDDDQQKLKFEHVVARASESFDMATLNAALRVCDDRKPFFPDWSELLDAAQPFLAERRAMLREERERKEAAERRRLAPPVYADPRDNSALLAEVFAKLAEGDRALKGSGPADVVTPYRDRPLSIDVPPVADASGGLKALWAARQGEA